MLISNTDIDIDFFDRKIALEGLSHIPAIELRGKERRKHLSGIYFHDIPKHPIDNMAVYDYDTAEQKGYFKVDFLNNSIYKDIRDENHLVELLTTEPPWDIFEDRELIKIISHVGNHFSIVNTIKPKNIDDLAVCIALIRPGKIHLVNKPRKEIDAEIWKKTDKYYFKKSHSYAYAASIIVQINLMMEGVNV